MGKQDPVYLTPRSFSRFLHYFQAVDRIFLLVLLMLLLGFSFTLLQAFRNFQNQKLMAFENEATYAVKLYRNLIGDHLNRIQKRLELLANENQVVYLTPRGKTMLEDLYRFFGEGGIVRAVSRISPEMELVFTVPESDKIGVSLAHQEHNQLMQRERKPLVSHPFDAVQGYKCVSIAQPLTGTEGFRGAVGVLIDFERFAKSYLDRIEVRGVGQAWIIDGTGEIIYAPSSIRQARMAMPKSLRLELVERMRQEQGGVLSVNLNPKAGDNAKNNKRLLAFSHLQMSSDLRSCWYICFEAKRGEILSALPHFQLLEPYCLYPAIVFILLAFAMVILYYILSRYYGTLLREQLFQAQKMELVSLFIGGITHDFNNIVQVLSGFTELLKKNSGQADNEDIQVVDELTKKAYRVTAQLAEFSGREKKNRNLADIDINGVIKDLAGVLRRVFPHRISIDVFLDERNPSVRAPLSQIEQILLNLALNARDAMPKNGGKLTFRTEILDDDGTSSWPSGLDRDLNYVLLTVADNGDGIPAELKKDIFEPFFTTKGERGTGLGLSTVAMIVRKLRGLIIVESEKDKGTRFLVYLPVKMPKSS